MKKLIKVHEKLSRLKNEEVKKLVNSYYSGMKVCDIIKKYSLRIGPCNLYKILPPVKVEDRTCRYCNVSLYRKRLSRTGRPGPRLLSQIVFCLKCYHRPDQFTCLCDNCWEIRSRNKLEHD